MQAPSQGRLWYAKGSIALRCATKNTNRRSQLDCVHVRLQKKQRCNSWSGASPLAGVYTAVQYKMLQQSSKLSKGCLVGQVQLKRSCAQHAPQNSNRHMITKDPSISSSRDRNACRYKAAGTAAVHSQHQSWSADQGTHELLHENSKQLSAYSSGPNLRLHVNCLEAPTANPRPCSHSRFCWRYHTHLMLLLWCKRLHVALTCSNILGTTLL